MAEPKLPDQTWSVTAEDKKQIVELGRQLYKVVNEYVLSKDKVHIRILAGAAQYILDLQMEKAKVATEDVKVVNKIVAENGLGDLITEPFSPDPEIVIETKEQKIARLKSEITALEIDPEVKAEIEDASIAPGAPAGGTLNAAEKPEEPVQ